MFIKYRLPVLAIFQTDKMFEKLKPNVVAEKICFQFPAFL